VLKVGWPSHLNNPDVGVVDCGKISRALSADGVNIIAAVVVLLNDTWPLLVV
jgi:hypothetical protein